MMDLTGIIAGILSTVTERNTYIAPVFTLESACEHEKFAKVFVTKGNFAYMGKKITITFDDNSLSVPIRLDSIFAKLGAIENIAFAKSTYRGAIEDTVLFQQLYDVKTRTFQYKKNNVTVTQQELSAPCMKCGIILPVQQLTIDHQAPQTDGEYEALLKTFRAFGLTHGAPQGPKGQAIQQHFTRGTAMRPIPTRISRPILTSTFSLDDRYTLNDEGVAIYSLIRNEGLLGDLLTACMHGLCNLRPMCGHCNTARGNPTKFI